MPPPVCNYVNMTMRTYYEHMMETLHCCSMPDGHLSDGASGTPVLNIHELVQIHMHGDGEISKWVCNRSELPFNIRKEIKMAATFGLDAAEMI